MEVQGSQPTGVACNKAQSRASRERKPASTSVIQIARCVASKVVVKKLVLRRTMPAQAAPTAFQGRLSPREDRHRV